MVRLFLLLPPPPGQVNQSHIATGRLCIQCPRQLRQRWPSTAAADVTAVERKGHVLCGRSLVRLRAEHLSYQKQDIFNYLKN